MSLVLKILWHIHNDIQVCLFVQLAPQVLSVQLDPKHKSTGLLMLKRQ